MEWLARLIGSLVGHGLSSVGERLADKGVPMERPWDMISTNARERKEKAELARLLARLSPYASTAERTCNDLCWRVVEEVCPHAPDERESAAIQAAWQLCRQLLRYEGYVPLPHIDLQSRLSTGQSWEAMRLARRLVEFYETRRSRDDIADMLKRFLWALLRDFPRHAKSDVEEKEATFVPLVSLYADPAGTLERLLGAVFSVPEEEALFIRPGQTLLNNLLRASGIDPNSTDSDKEPLMPAAQGDKAGSVLVQLYLANTPFADFFETQVPFVIPHASRFEHMHVVGGSGHGKTQLLQTFILRDLDALRAGRGSVIVIDSQGDMIRTITHLAEFRPGAADSLADRLVLIDPTDIEHPPCLNLFDFGLDRLDRYGSLEREKLLNGAIALYEYMFGALLGAELSQRQGVIFRYLGRLMMTVPGATIHTLREFMENPDAARPYVASLEGSARQFFETQFASAAFKDTRQQILNRLWGILSNSVLERMFSNQRNKLSLFEAMNSGKVVLINTAKDLLKQDGCSILGRFFIALITQAAQERAAIPAESRRSCFLYIDEAQDYFDESIGELFNQARKYRLGLVVAHQNLAQFGHDLLASVMASTAIKLVGGMSAADAAAFAREMGCEPEFLQSMRKQRDHTEFACFVRNLTPTPIRLSVSFGTMENRPRLTHAEYEELLERNRARYCGSFDRQLMPFSKRRTPEAGVGSSLPGEPELL